MRLEMTGSFDADGSAASSNDLLFLGFHGYSNDESGMVRIINAICATGSPDNTHHAVVPEKLRTLDHGRPWSDDQFASTRLSSNRDMSR